MKRIFLLAMIFLGGGAFALETGAANQILRYPSSAPAGTRPTYGSINLASSAAVGTSILPYANGGTNAATSWTQGSVFFAGASGFSQDNTNFFWDGTNHRLGLGVNTSLSYTLEVATGGGRIKGFATATASKTANYTATITDDLIKCDATSGTFTISLPAAATYPGKIYTVIKTDTSLNKVQVQGNGSDTINGVNIFSMMNQYDTVRIQSDGTSWSVI